MTDHPSLADALVAFQADCPQVKKDKTANVRSDKGNYSYTYADLADMVAAAYPVLAKHGLAFNSKPTLNADGRFVLAYRLWHGPSGETDAGEIALPGSGTPQAIGAAITYARRQAFSAVTGIVADEDNDAHDGGDVQYTQKSSSTSQRRNPSPVETAKVHLRELIDARGLDVTEVAERYKTQYGETLKQANSATRVKAFTKLVEDEKSTEAGT